MKKYLVIIIFAIALLFFIPRKNVYESFIIQEGQLTETYGFVIDSQVEGPVVCVIAGIHGNEPAGIEAAKHLNAIKLTKGKLIVIPEANAYSVSQGKRSTPNLGDLNRSFPGQEKGMAIKELAYSITEHIRKNQPDIVLDLHESSHYSKGGKFSLGQSIIYSQLGVSELVDNILLDINDDLDDKFVYFIDEKEGTINTSLSKLGIYTITVESDVSKNLKVRMENHKSVIESVLKEYEMINDE